MRAWGLGLLYDLHFFIWEYEKPGRIISIDKLFDKIHVGIEELAG